MGGGERDRIEAISDHDLLIEEPAADLGALYAAVLRASVVPMLMADAHQPDQPILLANQAFLDLTGYSEDEVLGRNCRFLQGPRTDPETVEEMRRRIANQEPFAVEIMNYMKSGASFWSALMVAPVHARDGSVRFFVSSHLDITRRRSSDDAFRQAQKMEAIGQLTGGLAHDFNNMLQVVSGNLQLAETRLSQANDVGGSLQAVALADRAARQAARLTQQLLTFARKTRLQPRDINLNALLVAFDEMLAHTLGNTIEMRLQVDPRLAQCSIDPTHAEMALLNVLMNARDALPGGGSVTIATKNVVIDAHNAIAQNVSLRPGNYVALTVTDDGLGMEPAILERATEPFFSTKGPGRGTGLGLAMVHGFVRQSGGRLEIESQAGKGSKVRLLFPAVAARRDSGSVVPAKPRAKVLPGGNETILVVDDNPDVLELAVAQLTELGYGTVRALSGEEAMRLLEEDLAAGTPKISMLFSDIIMPGGMNGSVLAGHARTLRPGLPVVLATGYVSDDVTRTPATEGILVLNKPYRRAELSIGIRAALDEAAEVPRPA